MPYLYLIRHGQPDFAGNYDSITAVGARQSTWLGQHFAARGLRFARVVSGTLQRQVATCDLILRELSGSHAVTQDARFNEYDHQVLLQVFVGDRVQALRASGDRRAYFSAIRDAMQLWTRHPGTVPGGETWGDFAARIHTGVAGICAGLERDDAVLIVTSGGVIGRFAADVLEAGAGTAIQLNLQTRNTSVTEVVYPLAGNPRLVTFNSIPHLECLERADAVTYS